MSTLRILLVEDVPEDAEITLRELRRGGLEFELRRVDSADDLTRECIDFAPDVVLSDFALPRFDGMSALGIVRRMRPDLPFIFVSGRIGEETAIESLRGGASDYVLKTNLARLPAAIRRALQDAAERAALRETEAALRLRDRAVEASPNPVMIVSATEPDMPLVYVNRAFERSTGYSRAEAIGRNCRFLQGEDRDQPELDRIRRAIAERRDGQAQLRNYRKDGSLFWSMLYVTPVRDPLSYQVTHFVGVQYDTTETKRYLDELEQQANHDAITGLANRNLLKDRLQQSLALGHRYEHRFSLAFIALDHFERVNDNLGHDLGDRLLQLVAQRLVACVGEGDTVARLGGNEFVLLVTEQVRADAAYRAVQRVMAALAQPFVIGQRELNVTCSVGVASFPRDGEDSATLLRNADKAMYRAKGLGRNTFQLYSSEMHANFGERLTLETDLWNALERNEFALHYQPKVELKSGRIIGMEALLRWQHPKNGMIPPGKFIPVAEESSLIVQIGNWVIREACAQNKAWQNDGVRFVPVAVNVSARQLHDRDLVETVRATLASTHLRPEFLEIELTESAVMRNADETIKTLAQLRGMDVRISLDDFGTGYSSLSYLKQLPVTGLKIDQSFIRDLAHDPDDAAIVRALIVVARELMLDVTAEGVETVEQFEFLKSHGCAEAQGYYFARPVPATEMRLLLERGTLPAARAVVQALGSA
jgi:diguanylate cyclase (GGDEF)-like protein/PAS domain S-box-containing protein